MFSSTIIATIARPTLSRAVCSVLDQELDADDFEVIVVNDTDQPLPEENWQQSNRVRILDTCKRGQAVARNAGAAIARGDYLHFLDDDDWMLPVAFDQFWRLAQRAGDADWLYAGTQVMDRSERPQVQLDHGMNDNIFIQVIAGEFIPLLSSFIKSEAFFNVGGFNPLLPVSEDIDLCRRIALRGNIEGTAVVVSCHCMGLTGSSSPRHLDLEYSRWAREKILDEPGVFARMRASAGNSYWRGRIVRAYLTSAIWNLQHRRPLTMGSRLTSALASLVTAGGHAFSRDFIKAIAGPYRSETFLRGSQEAIAQASMTQ